MCVCSWFECGVQWRLYSDVSEFEQLSVFLYVVHLWSSTTRRRGLELTWE